MTCDTTRRRAQSGLTLVELMISIVISGIVVSAALGMGFTMMNNYADQRAINTTERAAQASINIISKAVRAASPGAPDGQIFDGVSCGSASAIDVVNSESGPDTLSLVYASGGKLTSLASSFVPGDNLLHVTDPIGFTAGIKAVVTDINNAAVVSVGQYQGTGRFDIDNFWACSGSPAFNVPPPPAAGTPPPSNPPPVPMVIRAKTTIFFIDSSAAVGGVPTLMMDPDRAGPATPEPLAEGIEDMQIAIGVDLNGDGHLFENFTTTDEWFGNAVGDPTAPTIDGSWRALRVTLVARTLNEQSTRPQSAPPSIEDHMSSAVQDQFRRRLLTSTIEIRNLPGSP